MSTRGRGDHGGGRGRARARGRGGGRGAGSANPQLTRLHITIPTPPPSEAVLAQRAQEAANKAKQKKEKLAVWKAAEVNFPNLQEGPAASAGLVKANFFKITWDRQTKLHRYRIELDTVKGNEPTNRHFRRFLIRGMLDDEQPTCQHWATDWHTFIVSVGQLYKDYRDDKKSWRPMKHARAGPGGQKIMMVSKIHFDGLVQFSELDKLVRRGQLPSEKTYHPGHDLQALNIVFWKDIIGDDWEGARIGKKFYPDDQSLFGSINRCEKGKNFSDPQKELLVYKAKSGFFCSARPGVGSLLLNINTTTSAFFPVLCLQTWIYNRFNRDLIPETALAEVKGLQVDFQFAPGVPRKICGFSSYNVSKEASAKNPAISVHEEIVTSHSW